MPDTKVESKDPLPFSPRPRTCGVCKHFSSFAGALANKAGRCIRNPPVPLIKAYIQRGLQTGETILEGQLDTFFPAVAADTPACGEYFPLIQSGPVSPLGFIDTTGSASGEKTAELPAPTVPGSGKA